jgi:hypothetical protein
MYVCLLKLPLEPNSLISERFSAGIYVNLDPAAEEFEYEPDVDIKDLISLEDVMDEMGLGPNGGLMACFEYVPSRAFTPFYKRLF